MIWKKYTIDTTVDAEDLISEALSECGVEGIEIEDNVPLCEADFGDMFIDALPEILPDAKEDDGSAKIHFYIEDEMTDLARAKMLSNIREALAKIASFVQAGPLTITESESNEKDWRDNWKKFFHSFTIDDILIKPTWEEMPKGFDDKTLITIDPGAAFGTGSHETTRLCVRAINEYIKLGDRVLDVGTGSGILSIASLKLGASFALGTDIDPCSITAARENANVNKICENDFKIIDGNIIDDVEIQKEVGTGYDLVVANILAPAIILLQKEIPKHIKDGGIFIVSGIIDTKEKEVRDAFSKNASFKFLKASHDGEWVSLVYKKEN